MVLEENNFENNYIRIKGGMMHLFKKQAQSRIILVCEQVTFETDFIH